jgi:hypothetical protein
MNADAAPAVPLTAARPDRLFHTAMAAALLITAIAGFGPTYFYKPFHPSPPLNGLLHVHGLLFTAWLVLLIVQSGLIRSNQVALHKRLGIGGGMLAVLMVLFGIMVAVAGARRGKVADGMDPLGFMIFPFGQALLFGGFIAMAMWKRRQPELHRRFILLGSICLMTPAISRMVGERAALASMLTLLFVVVAMVHDWRNRGRVHSIYLWGGAIMLVSGPLRALLGPTAAWHAVARLFVG